jgi:hypothetical protein
MVYVSSPWSDPQYQRILISDHTHGKRRIQAIEPSRDRMPAIGNVVNVAERYGSETIPQDQGIAHGRSDDNCEVRYAEVRYTISIVVW